MASVTPLVEVLLIAALTIVAAASVGTIVLV